MDRSSNRRRQDFKKGADLEESRRRRGDDIVAQRKNKREENLQKKRLTALDGVSPSAAPDMSSSSATLSQTLEEMPSMVYGCWSDSPQEQFEATQKFRKILSIERNPPIDEVIKQGVIPRFVEFLERNDFPKLQFEAAWALTNVASGTSDHTRVVIDNNAIPIFVRLLRSPNDDVREQAVWALGNIAGDSTGYRNKVLEAGALWPLLEQLRQSDKLSMVRNATWTLSNFCRGKPGPDFELIRNALPALARHIHSNDEEILTDACWALSYLSDGPNEKIDKVIQAGVCRRLVELLMHPAPNVLVPALRTVGNIVTGDDMQTQVIINCGALSCLLHLVTTNQKKSTKKETCWTLSNITAGTKEQIQAVIDANIIPPLVQLLSYAEFDIKKEAAWALSNATSGGMPHQIKYLVSCGCIKPLCDLLTCSDARIIIVALEGLENILKVGEDEKATTNGMNPYVAQIEDCGGLDKIEHLQEHQNEDIYNKSVTLLETYFELEDVEGENLIPPGDQGAYAFGGGDAAGQGMPFNFGAP